MPLQNITSPTVFYGCYVQRFNCSIGLNSQPTCIDIELVPGLGANLEDKNNKATGFFLGSANPGSFSGFTMGAFNFNGLLQSWHKSWGRNGLTYNVKMVDPRIIFKDVHILLDGTGPMNGTIPNLLNAYSYYGTPGAADSSRYGMAFTKIRDFLSTNSGAINVYGKPFKLSFSSAFTNPTGIPSWYRINSNDVSLDQLLQQVSDDFGLDYYCYVDNSVYSSTTGVISTIIVQHIDRKQAGNNADITNFIDASQNNGILIQYQQGQELRSDPTTSVVEGDKSRYWYSPTQGDDFTGTSEVLPMWGRANDGSIIWGNYDPLYLGFADGTGWMYQDGYVLLDHLELEGSTRLDDYKVTVEQINISYISGVSVYPPTISRTFTTADIRGYRPKPLVMEASLYSQESWESMLWAYNRNFATALGLKGQRFFDPIPFTGTLPQYLKYTINMSILGSGILARSTTDENLIKAVYEATKTVAENNYGKTFIVNLPTSALLAAAEYGSEAFPRIEYEVATSAWSQDTPNVLNPPSGIGNFTVIHGTHNQNFKDDLGRVKPFASFASYDGSGWFGKQIDLSLINRERILLDAGTKQLILPVQVEQYEKDPDRAIVTLSDVVSPIPVSDINGDIRKYQFYRFLSAMGYNTLTIWTYDLIDKAGDNQEYGLGPQRLWTIPTTAGTKGLHIPLINNFSNYGPFTYSSGQRPGGCKIVRDSSLAPWTYANYNNMNTAGNQIAQQSTVSTITLDLAEITNAGTPEYNIGAALGNNTIITALTTTVGTDGLITNYSIRTFAIPPVRVTKLLQDKITQIYTESSNADHKITNLSRDVERLKLGVDKLHYKDGRTVDLFQNAGFLFTIFKK